MKNIIIFDIDALVPTRLGFNNNLKYVAPTINTLAKKSLNFTNAFSMGNPTEFALPGLFASSYLLDYNGYRHGILNNPITFSEVLKDNGYYTSSFINTYRPTNDGYDRGFKNSYKVTDFQVLEKNLMNNANWYREQYKNEGSIISKEKCIKDMIDYYDEYLDDILIYCKNWDIYKKDNIIPKSSIFDNISFNKIKEEILKDKKIFLKNKKNYIIDFFNTGILGINKISKKIVQDRYSFIKTTKLDLKIRFKLLFEAFFMFKKSTSLKSAKKLCGHLFYIIINGRKSLLTRYQSAKFSFKFFSNWLINKYDKKSPFYSYIKILDAHEQNIYSHDIQDESSDSKEHKLVSDFFKNLKKDKKYRGNVLYDCSINYVDGIIKNFLDFLSDQKLIDNTIIVITSDHGANIPNLPVRDDSNHRISKFHDELYKIPLIIYDKDSKPVEFKGLVSSVDINSTLLDMVGIKIPKSFRGKSLVKKNFNREYIISENQGRGPCDLEHKAIRVCVRSKFKKIVYEFKKYKPNSGKVVEAYDLINDSEEYYNLYDNKFFIKECYFLIEKAEDRIKDIFGIKL